MAKPKKPAPPATVPNATKTLDDIDVGRATARVKALRDQFNQALEDPDMREAMVRYLQNLLRDDQKK
jgi:hypothetical protein